MILLSSFVSLAVASAPAVSLQLVTTRPGVQPEVASRVLLSLQARLSRAGLHPTIASPCATRASQCLTSSAEGRAAALGVDVGQLKQQLVIRVEAVDQAGAAIGEVFETTTTAAELDHSLEGVDELIAVLTTRFVAPKKPEPSANLTTGPSPREPAPARPRIGAWVSTGGAIANAAGAITFLVLSFNARHAITSAQFLDPTGATLSHLPQSQLSRLGSEVTGFTIASIGFGAISVALGALATMLFLAD